MGGKPGTLAEPADHRGRDLDAGAFPFSHKSMLAGAWAPTGLVASATPMVIYVLKGHDFSRAINGGITRADTLQDAEKLPDYDHFSGFVTRARL
jgi:hypothetical protein